MSSADNVTFGAFRLDLHNECLWDQDRAIALRPKAFAVLKLLVQHSGQLVTKQQVLDTVWPGTFVTDAVLKDSVRQLRDALGDDANAPRYIETAHRRGYRFIGQRRQLTSPGVTAPAAPVSVAANANPVFRDAARQSTTVLGRERDLATVRNCFQRASHGKRQLVFITGEAGIGKTTLVEAFLAEIASESGVRVARGQCLEHYGSGEAYMPVLDAFSRLARGKGGASVIGSLRYHAPAWLAQMASLVAPSEREQLIQAPGPTRERMLREMGEAMEVLAAESPLVLVIEDLHWSDYSTLDLISYVARRRDPARLMVIATYRPVEVIISEHPLKAVKRELQAHGLCCDLALEYLSEQQIHEYIAIRFPGHQFQGRLARLIYQRTEGNPLFMVEAVEYLVREKWVVQDGSTWSVPADIAQLEHAVPDNVRQLIEKQIERLSDDERLVLEGAAVAGVECSSAAMAAGLDRPTEWVEKHCEELARRHQFLSAARLVELPDGSLTPRHRFRHVLYLEVPYALIPQMRRSQMHHRIAIRGMEIFGERTSEIAAELAMHFEQGRDWPQALKFLTLAAENATRRSAHHEAADLARRGLEVLKLIPEMPARTQDEIKLRMILGVALMVMKGFASSEVDEVFAPARVLFWSQGPSPELFHMLRSLGLYYQYRGEVQSSLEMAEQLLDIGTALDDGALIMEAHRSIGAALVILGRCTEALTHLDTSGALYAKHGKHRHSLLIGRDCKVMGDSFAAIALWALGDCDGADARMTAALKLAHELRHPETLLVAGHFAANLHQLRGEAALTYERAKSALDVASEYGLELWRTYGLIETGWADAELGDGGGIERMQRGLAAYELTGAQLWAPYFLGLLADQLAKADRTQESLTVLDKAIACADQSGERYSLAELYRLKGEFIMKSMQGAPEVVRATDKRGKAQHESAATEAQACFAKSLEIATEQNAKSWEMRTRKSMERFAARR